MSVLCYLSLFYFVDVHFQCDTAQRQRRPRRQQQFPRQQFLPQRQRPQHRRPNVVVPPRRAVSNVHNLNVTQLSIVVSGLEGTTEGTGTLLRPTYVPRIYAAPAKSQQYHVPFLINVNSIFIRSLRNADEQRLCVQRNHMARLNNQINPQCQTLIRLNIPVDLIIPTNVESTVVDNDSPPDVIEPMTLINYGGSNNRMAQDLYRMNYAVGDPMRARRVKRTPEVRFKRSNPLFTD